MADVWNPMPVTKERAWEAEEMARRAPAAVVGDTRLTSKMVVFMTRGMSLQAWERGGMFAREVVFYRRLRSQLTSMAVITYGGVEEGRFAERLGDVSILANRWHVGANLYSVIAPLLHIRALREATVLRAHQLNGAWCAVIAKLLFRKQLVVRCGYLWSEFYTRLTRSAWKRRLARSVEWMVLRVADRIIVAKEADRQRIVDRHRIDRAKIHVIPNYVDTERFRPMPQIQRRPGQLCCVGRLDGQKNPLALLEAIRGLPGVQLAIIGDGPLRCVIKDRISAWRLPVELLGVVPNDQLPELLNRSQAFVMPSHFEGHPKALLEAMACGVPVIGADVPGIRDVIAHRRTGFLCGTSAQEIRAAIRAVLEDEGLREEMAANGSAHVSRECSLDRVIAKERELFASLDGADA